MLLLRPGLCHHLPSPADLGGWGRPPSHKKFLPPDRLALAVFGCAGPHGG